MLIKYTSGCVLSDDDYKNLINLILSPVKRSWQQMNTNSLLSAFGMELVIDDEGNRTVRLIEEQIERIKVEAWEGIVLDILTPEAFDVVNCFDFDSRYAETESEELEQGNLRYSFGAWKFSSNGAEQGLSNALRNALMYTLIGYCYGDRRTCYGSFKDFFNAEFYNRVNVIYGIWSKLEKKADIKYIPILDSFYNLDGLTKDELINALRAVLDNNDIAVDDKESLKKQLIESAEDFHLQRDAASIALEQTLIKPGINFIMQREKAKETLEAAHVLLNNSQYRDCINRCYYAMMYALRSLLENKGLLSEWKSGELKESESHKKLNQGLTDLVASNVLDTSIQNDYEYVQNLRLKCDYALFQPSEQEAGSCYNKAKAFLSKVDTLTV